MQFQLHVQWMMTGIMHIEAESLEEAKKKAYECELLPEGEYISDSFRVEDEDGGVVFEDGD